MPFSGRAHDGASIALTTDFGSDDPYVGVVKGVIAGINASACIMDLCHGIEPQSIAQGGFLLANSYHFFPKGSIHVAVVDPDVGTERRIVLLSTNDYYFIAPDNGLLRDLAQLGRFAGREDLFVRQIFGLTVLCV